MVDLFYQGGGFMWPILGLLVAGLIIILERLISLFRAGVNTRKFLTEVKGALKDGGLDAALEKCESTTGPVASIVHAGLSRANKGLEAVEKAITNAGSLEMSFLEKGMIWLSTIIVLAPMLGFTGTVAGMIEAFQEIAVQNDISPAIVAGGISKALLTTAFGLIVAMIIQVFNNLFVSKIDKLIIDMEESSIELIDYLVELTEKK